MHIHNMNAIPLMVQKVWQKLKFLEMQVKGQGHKVIDLGVNWKGLISWVYIPNMKSLSLTVKKLWPRRNSTSNGSKLRQRFKFLKI